MARTPEETRELQAVAARERQRAEVWWKAYREGRDAGVPQADARDRADLVLANYSQEHGWT